MSNKTYIGLHPNNLNRTEYGQVVLYVEGEPVAFFSGSGDVVISGSLAIEGITNVSASIAAAVSSDTGSFMLTGSVNNDTITFTKGDGSTFDITITSVTSSISASYAATASNVGVTFESGVNAIRYLPLVDSDSFSTGNDNLKATTSLSFLPLTNTFSSTNFQGNLQGTASYASFAVTASNALSMSFDGDRPVTQPLLPDLVNYTPGTNTVIDFLERVFYPDPGFGIEIYVNEPLSILESARSGSYIWANTVGWENVSPPPIGKFTANTPVSWSLQANNLLAVDPNTGELSLKTDLSGSSVYTAPSTFAGTVTATAVAGGFKTRNFTVSILEQSPPEIITTSYFNTVNNIFTTGSGAHLGYITVQDIQRVPYGSASLIASGGADVDKFIFVEDDNLPGSFWTRYRVETTQALNSGSYTVQLTASNGYNKVEQTEITTTIEENTPPTIVKSTNFLVNIGDAVSGSEFGQLRAIDDQLGFITPDSPKNGVATYAQIDRIVSASLSGPDADKLSLRENIRVSVPSYIDYPYEIFYKVYFAEAGTAGTYNITASAYDQFGYTASYAIDNTVQVPVPSLPSPNGTFYMIESALSGSKVTTNINGIVSIGTTEAKMVTNQPVSWSLSDDLSGLLAISGSTTGFITIKGDLSGSAYQNGSILTATVRATNAYSLYKENNISVNITDNVAPSITTTFISSSKNHYYTKDAGGVSFGYVRTYDNQGENVKLIEINGPGAPYFTTASLGFVGNSINYLTSSQALNSGSYELEFTSSDSYGQFAYANATITVTPNNPPVISLKDTSYNGVTSYQPDVNDATSGSNLGILVATDGDNGVDNIASFIFTGTDASKFNPVLIGTLVGGYSYYLQPTQNLTSGTYNLTGSATDGFGYTTNTPIPVTVTVQAPSIPDPNGSFYIIESAESGSAITTATSGIPGTQAQFSTNQAVTWTLNDGTYLHIDQDGKLSLRAHVSGSAKQAGSVIASEVVATNAFGASRSLTFTVAVTNDQDPVITNSLADKNNNKTTTATGFGTITISDPQALGNVSLTDFNGPDVASFTFSAGTAGSTRVYTVSSSAALNSGSYSFSVTGSDAYNQEAKAAFTINVIENLAPTITYTGFSKTVTQATNGAEIGTVLVADPQDDSIASFTLSGPDASKFNASEASSTATSKTYSITATQNLTAGTYAITGSGTDSFGLTTVEPKTVTISPSIPDIPSVNGTFRIIESAVSGALITTDPSGIAGSQAQMTTDQSVSWSLSPGIYLHIDTDGYLSLRSNISGSAKTFGSIVSATIRATNTYNEYSERLIDVDVTENLAPTLTYTGLTVDSGSASATGQTLGTVKATDPQSLDSITSIAITGGTDAAKFALALSGSTSYTKTYNINAAQDLGVGAYEIQLTATDSFNKQTVENKTITVQAVGTAQVYIYTNNTYAAYLNSQKTETAALQAGLGYSGGNYAGGFLLDYIIESGSLGDNTISLLGGSYTATLRQSGITDSLLNIKALGTVNGNFGVGEQVLVFFPSSSALDSLPSEMYTGAFQGTVFNPVGGSGKHGFINYSSSPPFNTQAGVHYFTLNTAVNGTTEWGVVFTYDAPTLNTTYSIPAYGETLP